MFELKSIGNVTLLATLCFGLIGCTSSSRIFETTNMGSFGKAVSVDGRQRFLIYGSSAATDAQGQPRKSGIFWWQRLRRFCAEPSPDVFSVAAAAYGANLDARYAGPTNAQVAGGFSFSSSEAAEVVSRTQTINMLREAMYRNCERYLNGAITPEEHTIQAIRDQRMMVSILAIEQITGVYRAESQAIASQASAAAGNETSSKAILLLHDLRKTEQARLDAVAAAEAAVAGRKADCEADPKKSDKCADADLASLEAAVQAAKTAATTATENRTAIESRMPARSQAENPAVATRSSAVAPVSAPQTTASTEAHEKMATIVKSIVDSTFASDEVELLCIRLLMRDSTNEAQNLIIANCMSEVAKALSKAPSGPLAPLLTPSPPPSAPPPAARP
jgi:hypothetical protein